MLTPPTCHLIQVSCVVKTDIWLVRDHNSKNVRWGYADFPFQRRTIPRKPKRPSDLWATQCFIKAISLILTGFESSPGSIGDDVAGFFLWLCAWALWMLAMSAELGGESVAMQWFYWWILSEGRGCVRIAIWLWTFPRSSCGGCVICWK